MERRGVPEHRKVFYSWQSDLPGSLNRNFIEDALRRAARAIRNDDTIEVDPVIDRDTVGVPGSPEISGTIFNKIDNTDVFICDVSIINPGSATRLTPNPNALIELGYALKTLGFDKIIMVFNEAFGKLEQLPFDLRMRRVVTYTLPDGAEKAPVRTELVRILTIALRSILEGTIPSVGEVVEPVSLAEQVRVAIDAGQPARNALIRRYMTWLVGEIAAINPEYGDQQDTWDTKLLEAIDRTPSLVVGFARIAEAIAAMNDTEAAETLYKGFSEIANLYTKPAGPGITSYRDTDFDLAKFIGHELFVTFFSFLLRERRWVLIGDLLSLDLLAREAVGMRPIATPYTFMSQYLQLLELHNQWRKRLRKSIHADLLNTRHTTDDLGRLVPMQQFIDADFLLGLRSVLENQQQGRRWYPWSGLYLQDVPFYLLESTRRRDAQQLLLALGLTDTAEFVTRYKERVQIISRLLGDRAFAFEHPLSRFDPDTVGSR